LQVACKWSGWQWRQASRTLILGKNFANILSPVEHPYYLRPIAVYPIEYDVGICGERSET